MKSKDAARRQESLKPQISLQNFSKHIGARTWSDAEKELDTIRQNSENTHWSRGYVKALEGLLLSYKNDDDKYIYLPRFLADNKGDNVDALKRDFGEFSSNELHGEYDRGYFKALEEYLALVPSLNVSEPNVQPPQQGEAPKEQLTSEHKE